MQTSLSLQGIGLSILSVALGSLGALAAGQGGALGGDPGGAADLLGQAQGEERPTHLLVVDKAAGQLLLLDLESGSVEERIDVGHGPHEVVAVSAADSPTGAPLAIVSLYGDGQRPGFELAVIDLAERSVRLVSLEPYARPHGLAWVPGTAAILVTVEQNDKVLLVDYPRGQVTAEWDIPARLPHMVVTTPDGAFGYASSITGASVTRLPLSGGEPLKVEVGAGAEGVATTRDGAEVWVGSNDEHEIHVLSAGLDLLDVLSTCNVPIRVTSVGDDLMAATCYGDNLVQLFDAQSHEVRASIELPGADGRPVGTLATADGTRLYVATTADGLVHEIDLESLRVQRSFQAGIEPDGLALITLTR